MATKEWSVVSTASRPRGERSIVGKAWDVVGVKTTSPLPQVSSPRPLLSKHPCVDTNIAIINTISAFRLSSSSTSPKRTFSCVVVYSVGNKESRPCQLWKYHHIGDFMAHACWQRLHLAPKIKLFDRHQDLLNAQTWHPFQEQLLRRTPRKLTARLCT